jgi:hypothetical protein
LLQAHPGSVAEWRSEDPAVAGRRSTLPTTMRLALNRTSATPDKT